MRRMERSDEVFVCNGKERESSFSVELEDGRGDGAEGEYNPVC